MDYTQEQINDIVAEAREAARQAATKYFNEVLGAQDRLSCGFAWVNILGVRGNTKLGRMLTQAGVTRNAYHRAHQIWNPSGLGVQNIDCKEEGARAAAQVFRKYGFESYPGSRLD